MLSHLGHQIEGVVRSRRPGLHHPASASGQGPESPGADLHPETVGHDLFNFVGFIEDHNVVGREHGTATGQVGSVQVGVDHHHVGRRRPAPGIFGEALPARRATECSRAFAGGCRHHGPRPEVGLEVKLGPVPGGGVLRPLQ